MIGTALSRDQFTRHCKIHENHRKLFDRQLKHYLLGCFRGFLPKTIPLKKPAQADFGAVHFGETPSFWDLHSVCVGHRHIYLDILQ